MLNNLKRGVCWKDSKHLDTYISGEETTEKYPKYIVTDSKGYYRKIFWHVIYNEDMKSQVARIIEKWIYMCVYIYMYINMYEANISCYN